MRLDGRLKHQLIVDLQNEPARRQRSARAPLKASHRALDDVCRGALGDAVERGPLCSAAGPAIGAGQIRDRPPIASQCLLVWRAIGQRKMSVGENLQIYVACIIAPRICHSGISKRCALTLPSSITQASLIPDEESLTTQGILCVHPKHTFTHPGPTSM